MKNYIKKASVKFWEHLLYFQHFMQIFAVKFWEHLLYFQHFMQIFVFALNQ